MPKPVVPNKRCCKGSHVGSQTFVKWAPNARKNKCKCSTGNKCIPKGVSAQQVKRNDRAICEREELVKSLADAPIPRVVSNNDATLSQHWGSFGKALPQNANGTPKNAAYEQLLRALASGRSSDFEKVPLGETLKLVNPQASLSFALSSGDSWQYNIPPAPSATSAESAAEMTEVYAEALLRDVPFTQYAAEAAVPGSRTAIVLKGLNALRSFTGPRVNGLVTAQTLFRGNSVGDLDGNYVSQLLYVAVPTGGQTNEQKYAARPNGTAFLNASRADLIAAQNGESIDPHGGVYKPNPQFIVTGRDLAEYVHFDYPGQPFLQAALILFGFGARFNPGNPYANGTITNQAPFATFGMCDFIGMFGNVTQYSLEAAWVAKWMRNMRVRPEVFALRVDQVDSGDENWPIDAQVLPANNCITALLQSDAPNNLLLPLAYPEGSPAHPSYPAGHAVMAGACATLLKAVFDGTATFGDGKLPDPVEPTPDGQNLVPYAGGDTLTLDGEINKLASNVANARNIAGVHYRSDGDAGILYGEKVAVRYLRDKKTTYNEPVGEWTFVGFDGTVISI